ncbi:MAG: hypothetical protein LUD83_06925, partial [Clostridiales bacterium]|nr:hypothetical protein [Clostridiales bacterium]
ISVIHPMSSVSFFDCCYSIIVELAEFYSVSISEIIDGERNDEKMNDESKKIVDYASTDKEELLKRIKNYSAVALLTLVAASIIWVYDYSDRFAFITSTLFTLSIIFNVSVWMMSNDRIAEMKKNRTLWRRLLIGVIVVLFSLTAAVTLLVIGIF